MVPKKVDKQLKTLIVSRQDFQSAIELLKQYNDIFSKLYSDLYNAVIHKKKRRLEGIKDFVMITITKETLTVLSIMSNEVRKENKILKRLGTWRLFIKNCVLQQKNHLVIDAFFVYVCLKSSHIIVGAKCYLSQKKSQQKLSWYFSIIQTKCKL